MRILVAGAGGQLGRALCQGSAGHEIIGLRRQELDITSEASVRRAFASVAPECVINAAAYNRVDDAETHSDDAFRVNATGPHNLAQEATAAGIPLVHVSTDYVFDGTAGRPYHELDAPNPLSAYGRSKLAGEEAVREIHPRHFVVRTAWLYAAGGQNFPQTILSLADRAEVRVVDDQVGSPTYVPHLARALFELIDTKAFGTHHLAGGGATSWYGFACALYDALGIETPVRPVSTREFPRPAPRPRYSALATIQSPRIGLPPWEEGLREFAKELSAGSGASTGGER